MRIIRCLAFLCLGLALCLGRAGAAEILEEQWAALNPSALEEAAGEEMEEIPLTPSIDLAQGLQTLAERGMDAMGEAVSSTVRTGVLLMLAAMLCGLLDVTQETLKLKGLDLTALAGTTAILALAMTDVSSLAAMGREAMEQMEQFSKAVLPTMTAAAVASGSLSGAAVRQTATMLFSDVLLTLMNRLLLPMVYLYTAACAGYAAVGNEGLRKIAGLIKWGITTVLTAVLTAYVTWLTAASAISGTADALAAKTASFAISGMVPVVGGILASATETVVAGAGLLKNAVGIFGLLATLAFCLLPFLQLGVHYLVYKVTSALAATLSGSRIAGLIGEIGTAFGLILGMTGAGALVLLVSMVSGIAVNVR